MSAAGVAMMPALAMKISRRVDLKPLNMAVRMVEREEERSHCMKVIGDVGASFFASAMTSELD